MAEDSDPATVVARLAAADQVGAALGLEVVEAAAGRVSVAMTLGPEHVNANGVGHGGVLFTMADLAMQFASNSHGPVALATGASIDFVAACRSGDRLRADAVEVSLRGRAGVYDVAVVGAGDELVALFRGTTLQLAAPPKHD